MFVILKNSNLMSDVKKIKAKLKPFETEQKTKYFSISNSLE